MSLIEGEKMRVRGRGDLGEGRVLRINKYLGGGDLEYG